MAEQSNTVDKVKYKTTAHRNYIICSSLCRLYRGATLLPIARYYSWVSLCGNYACMMYISIVVNCKW